MRCSIVVCYGNTDKHGFKKADLVMEFVELTEEQRQSFGEDGYLVVRNALDRETVERLLVEADKLAAFFLKKPQLAGKPEYNHLDLRRGLLKEKSLLSLVANSTTVPLV